MRDERRPPEQAQAAALTSLLFLMIARFWEERKGVDC